MKKRTFILLPIMTMILVIVSLNRVSAQSESLLQNPTTKAMKNFVSIIEIPALEINRASKFYESLLTIDIEVIPMQGTQMGLFPSDGLSPSVVITQAEGYVPSEAGVLVYLNGGDDLTMILNKVEKSGGKVVLPKTFIDSENGYFAWFLDSEGNKMGLHSPN